MPRLIMPRAYIMVGLPCSGKSTWISQCAKYYEKDIEIMGNGAAVLSTDANLEAEAASLGKTYSEHFSSEAFAAAQKKFDAQCIDAMANHKMIFWDQTNLTKKKRKMIVEKLTANGYDIIIAMEFNTDIAVILERNKNRTGKTIPVNVIMSMQNQKQPVSRSEGFWAVYRYNSDSAVYEIVG